MTAPCVYGMPEHRQTSSDRLRGHTDMAAVESVAFTSDGRTLASGSLDGTLRLWEVNTGSNFAKPSLDIRMDGLECII